MPKYYFSSGTLQLIFSTSKEPYEACRTIIHEINENDELDEFIYCDERGMRDYVSADPDTKVFDTERILRLEGWV
jgi:hypothetical protein